MRRNDIDICADILNVAQNGAKKTQLVYKANLNFSIVKKYIQRLGDNQLLSSVNGYYTTTEKGRRFLQNYREFVVPFSARVIGDWEKMADLTSCPICRSLVFSNVQKYGCRNCGSIFSKVSKGGIVVNSVGKIESKDIRNVLTLVLQNMKISRYGSNRATTKF